MNTPKFSKMDVCAAVIIGALLGWSIVELFKYLISLMVMYYA